MDRRVCRLAGFVGRYEGGSWEIGGRMEDAGWRRVEEDGGKGKGKENRGVTGEREWNKKKRRWSEEGHRRHIAIRCASTREWTDRPTFG